MKSDPFSGSTWKLETSSPYTLAPTTGRPAGPTIVPRISRPALTTMSRRTEAASAGASTGTRAWYDPIWYWKFAAWSTLPAATGSRGAAVR